MIVNNNIRSAILDINKHLTNFKTAFLTSLLYGRLRYMLPMPWQMHKTNERRSLFYQTFEISLQLAILFIFLKLQTFSGATFSSRLGYCELLVLIFFMLLIPFFRPEPTSHCTCGIAAIIKWGKTNSIYLMVFHEQYI